MSTQSIPSKYAIEFSTVHHVTSISSAMKILESQTIYGRDPDRHANFGAIFHKQRLAREVEVSLEFEWSGEQRICFSDCFVQFKPDSGNGGPKPNVLYHIFNDYHPFNEGDDLKKRRYWQSNLYPGSNGLVFKGVSGILYSESQPQSILRRIVNSKAREEHREYLWAKSTKEKINQYIGKVINVPSM